MRLRRFVYVFACGAFVTGCASTAPPPAGSVDAPIVWASTVGGCTEPSHAPFPDYGAEVAYTATPHPTKKVPPVYPDAAREAKVTGTVEVAALVCEHGHVVATRVTRSIPQLDVAATDAVRQWEFKPASIPGLPVAAWTKVPVKFAIQ